MGEEEARPKVIIHWGGEHWRPTDTNDLEPVARIYGEYASESEYVARGVELAEKAVDDYLNTTTTGRQVKARGDVASYKNTRKNMARSRLEAELPHKFYGQYESLCAYVLSLEVQSDDAGDSPR